MKHKFYSIILIFIFFLLRLTIKYKFIYESEKDKEFFKNFLKTKRPNKKHNAVIAFFHQDEYSLIPYFMYKDISLLISKSKDGEILTRAAKLMGYIPIRGSSSRGAVAGLINCIRKVREGYPNAIAVDGPRGPIFKVKDGVCALSNKTNYPIIPLRSYPSKMWILHKAWNKGKIPKFFSTVTIKVGKIQNYDSSELEQALLSM